MAFGKKLLQKVMSTVDQGASDSAPKTPKFKPEKLPPLSEQHVYRYRKQRGVNLGSWFTLERWITDAPYQGTKGHADLDTARGRDAKQILENHWDSWIVESDWEWLSQHGFNAVRIPIGYYHVCGADRDVLNRTDFADFYDVYEGAWPRIVRAIETADRFGIGVLIDLHAVPGAQNKDAHSGTGTGKVGFWEGSNPQATIYALRVILSELHTRPNVIGVELMNEPANSMQLQGWYETALNELRCMVPMDFPLYVGDAWDAPWYSQWTGTRPDFVVLDHHLYRSFTAADHKLSGDAHAAAIRSSTKQSFHQLSNKSRGNFVIGEWSAALNPASLGGGNAGEQDRQRRVFVRAQLEVYEECCAGYFWWTYKKGNGWDAGWCVRDAVTAEIMPKYLGRKRDEKVKDVDQSQKAGALKKARDQHLAYWAQKGSSANQTWRFDDGFSVGWDDARLFLKAVPQCSSVPDIGFKTEWTNRRAVEHVTRRGGSPQVWEFEHGHQQGYDAAMATTY